MDKDLKNILIQAAKEGKYDKLLQQLLKDIRRAGLEQEFDLGGRPKVLTRNLIAQIYELIVTDFEGYLNLLYLIDIPESSIKNLPVYQVDEVAQAVSTLIIKRELKKLDYKG